MNQAVSSLLRFPKCYGNSVRCYIFRCELECGNSFSLSLLLVGPDSVVLQETEEHHLYGAPSIYMIIPTLVSFFHKYFHRLNIAYVSDFLRSDAVSPYLSYNLSHFSCLQNSFCSYNVSPRFL